jgi:gliding motility-associated-like protein
MLNKKVNCSSLSSDGSDFSISSATPNSIINAVGRGCAFSFDADTLELTMQNLLIPGTYTITSKVGTDNNTLLDNCENQLPVGLTENLVFAYALPTKMDSIVPVICIQDTLKLVFSRPMKCSSIAMDGSDFFITGPSSVNIKSANGICSSGLTDFIEIILNNPIRTNGNYQLHLTVGTDGNSIINECGMPTAVGSIINFSVNNVTNAEFTFQVGIGCKYDTVSLSHNGNNGANTWNWTLANGTSSFLQNPILITKDLGITKTQLTVSNGFCSDTSSVLIDLIDHRANASFNIADTICLKDSLNIIDKSGSNSINSYWDFGNGITSLLRQPINIFYETIGQNNKFLVKHIVENIFNCTDTSFKILFVLPVCYIDIPSGFTPNGDGLNDYLYPLNAFKARNLSFKVYNRYGQVIYESSDWHQKWDGRLNGELQPSGTYVWTLDYTHRDTGQSFHLKGTTVLIR